MLKRLALVFLVIIVLGSLNLVALPAFAFHYPDGSDDHNYEEFGPRPSQIMIKIYTDYAAELAGFKNKEFDVMDWALDPVDYQWFETNDPNHAQYSTAFEAEFGLYEYDTQDQVLPTSIVSFRQAISYMLDKDYFIRVNLPNAAAKADSPIASITGWYNPTLTDLFNLQPRTTMDPVPDDPADWEAAYDLLVADMGEPIPDPESPGFYTWTWPSPFPTPDPAGLVPAIANGHLLVFARSDSSPGRLAQGEYLRSCLEDKLPAILPTLGKPPAKIHVDLYNVGRPVTSVTVMREYWFHYYTGGWSLSRDPDFLQYYQTAQITKPLPNAHNYPCYSNPNYDNEVDAMMYSATIGSASNPSDAAYHACVAQQIFMSEAGIVPMWTYAGYKAYLANWRGVVNQIGFGVNNWWTFLNAHKVSSLGGDTIRYGFQSDVQTLNPILNAYSYWDGIVLDKVYDPLIRYSPYDLLEDRPWLASSWRIGNWTGPYGKVTMLTFSVREAVAWQDVPFHDRTAITYDGGAELDGPFTNYFMTPIDIAFSFVYQRDNLNGNAAYLMDNLDHVELNPYWSSKWPYTSTVPEWFNTGNPGSWQKNFVQYNSNLKVDQIVVKLNTFMPWLGLHTIGEVPIIPMHIWSKIPMIGSEGLDAWGNDIVYGTGPYVLFDRTPGVSITMVPFESGQTYRGITLQNRFFALYPSPKFKVGDQVRTTDNLHVREGPGLGYANITTMPKGSLGEVVGGPVEADWYVWWEVDYAGGVRGWSAQDWLEIMRDFSISASPTSLIIQQGRSGSSAITTKSINGFNQPVHLTVSGAPSGVTATLNPSQVTPPANGSKTSTLTVSVATTATTGSYTLTVKGTSGTLTHSTFISLIIIAPPVRAQAVQSNPLNINWEYPAHSPGEIFTVYIDVVNVGGLFSFQAGFRFSTRELNVLNVEEGGFLSNNGADPILSFPGIVNDAAGLVTAYGYSLATVDKAKTGSGHLIKITFQIDPGLAPPYSGTYPGTPVPMMDLTSASGDPAQLILMFMDGVTEITPTPDHIYDSSFTLYTTQNQPPSQPGSLAQRTDGISIPVGASVFVLPIAFKGEPRDPNGDRVKLQVELRRLDEYGGQFNENAGGFKESEFVQSGSVATAYVYELNDGDYHWRARAVDDQGNAGDWKDFGDNGLLEADFVFPTGAVHGTVSDGHGHHLSDAKVELLQRINIGWSLIASTTTDGNGEYSFASISPSTYTIMVSLICYPETPGNPIFEVLHNSGPVAYGMTREFTITRRENKDVDIDFGDPSLESEVPVERLSDMAAIYFHVKQVVDFVRISLGVSLDLERPIDVHAFSTSTETAYYDSDAHEVHIGEKISTYDDNNRPMNREWHEMFHAVMDYTIGFPAYPQGVENHGGFHNPTTTDSLVEGWAEFWSCALARTLGLQNPYVYVWWGRPTSFERNWRVWDTLGLLDRQSEEEFAVASLLWDMIDPINPADADFISLSIEELWGVIGSQSLTDMRALYERFEAQGIGSNDANGNGLSDLDELFVAHSFFADANGNERYDAGEDVGWGGVPGRRNTPDIPGAYLLIDFVDQNGNPKKGVLVVEVKFEPPNNIYDYSYEVELNAGNNMIGLAVAPAYEEAEIRMKVCDSYGNFGDTFIINNTSYWAGVENSTLGYAFKHTFQVSVPLPVGGYSLSTRVSATHLLAPYFALTTVFAMSLVIAKRKHRKTERK